MNLRILMLAVAALCSCTDVHPCAQDSECSGAGHCDLSVGFCVFDDAGTGVSDGGLSCTNQCAAWQSCRPSVAGGDCVNAAIEIVEPAQDGALYASGSSITLRANVTKWDGGAWEGADVPWSSDDGQGGALASSAQFATTLTAGDAGSHSLTVGWSDAQAQRAYTVQSCATQCAAYQECQPTASGGTCGSARFNLVWVTPAVDAGVIVGPQATVPLQLRITKPDGGLPPASLTSVPFSVGGFSGQLTRVSGSFSFAFDAGSVGGVKTVTAGWAPTDSSATTNFTVDTQGPTLTVIPPTCDGGVTQGDFAEADPLLANACRRDDVLTIRVTSPDTDVDHVNLRAKFGVGAETLLTDGGVCSATAFCRDFTLDVSQVDFPGFRGSLSLSADGVDRFNNASNAVGQVPVSRWLWARRVASGAPNQLIRATPSIGSHGRLFVGVSNAAPTLVAIDSNGQLAWLADGGTAIVSGPLVGVTATGRDTTKEYVFYQDSSSGELRASETSGRVAYECPTGPGSSINEAGVAVSQNGTAGVSAIAIQPGGASPSDTVSRVISIHPTVRTCPSSPPTEAGLSPSNIVLSDVGGSTAIVYANAAGTMCSATELSSGITISPFSVALGSFGTTNGLSMIAGTSFAGGGGPGIGRFFAYQWLTDGGSANLIPNEPVYNAPSSSLVVTADGLIGVTKDGGSSLNLVRLDSNGGASLSSLPGLSGSGLSATFSNSSAPSPLAGDNNQLYIVDDRGRLFVLPQDFSSSTTPQWVVALPSSIVGANAPVSASPTLDCSRRRAGGRNGSLYIATETGWLVSYLVDSSRLDPTAPWPKYARDARNTGNFNGPAIADEGGCP